MSENGGRPPRLGNKARTYFRARCTPTELERLKARAAREGLTVSDYLRNRVLDCPVHHAPKVPEANLKIYEALARTAANINQLAHHLNEGRITGKVRSLNVATVHEELRRMYGHVAALRRDLMGVGHGDPEHQKG